MRRWLALLLVLVLWLPLAAGCWDRQEVNDLAIVDLVGIDTAEEGLRLTVSVLVPVRAQTSPSGGGGSEGGPPMVSYSVTGESVMDAMTKIQARLSRRLFWAHARVLIIGEEFARGGVRRALDFWSRHREPRMQMQVAIAQGEAADFVSASPRLEKLMSEAVREILNQRILFRVTMKDFLGALSSETDQPIAPLLRLLPTDGAKDAQVVGTAVFNDDRMVGWLDQSETRGLLWLRGVIHSGVVTVAVPSGGEVSMMIIRSQTKIRPDFSTGRLRMAAHFVAEDDIYETSAPIDLSKPETVRVVEELLRRKIAEAVSRTLDKTQHELNVDILLFGESVNRAAPLRWEGGLKQRWATLFPDVPVDITVTATVRRSGEHGSPLGTKEWQIQSDPKVLRQEKEGGM